MLILTFIPGIVFGKELSEGQTPYPEKMINITFDQNWKTLGFKKNKRTEFSLNNDVLQLKSQQAVAFYHLKLQGLSQISHCPWRMSYKWRVLSATNMTSQKLATGDDRPIAVHIWINDPSHFGWFKGRLARLLSLPTPGYMLSYTWGIVDEWGQTFPNPHLPDRAFIRVLRPKTDINGSWFSESIEVSQDIDAFFGPPVRNKKIYVVISADTEDSHGSAYSEIKELQLHIEQCQPMDVKK